MCTCMRLCLQIVTKSPLELNLTCDGKKSGCGTIKVCCCGANAVSGVIAFLDELGGPSWTKGGMTMVVVVVPCVTLLHMHVCS